jgi:hypothetical protein
MIEWIGQTLLMGADYNGYSILSKILTLPSGTVLGTLHNHELNNTMS